MGKIRCNARGCEKQLWIPRVGEDGTESSATCGKCKQVALCIEHLSVLWKRGGACPKCKAKLWAVKLFEGVPFSPQLQVELLTSGGRLEMIDQASLSHYGSIISPDHADELYQKALADSSEQGAQVILNVAARSQQTLTKRALDPSPPRPYDSHYRDPYGEDHGQSTHDVNPTRAQNGKIRAIAEASRQGALPPPPRGWRLITQGDLSARARGLGGGIAIDREGPKSFRMMDDDRIMRQLEVEGDIINISQSPRKQRLIIERSRDGWRELVYVRGKEIQGFLTNPISDDCDIFGVQFINDTGFLIFVERPDQRIELREGRFKKARQVQTRVVGSSLHSVPLAPSVCLNGQMAFFFKGVSEGRSLPMCRRVSNGEDIVIAGELTDLPVLQAASRSSLTLAWVTNRGDLWVSSNSAPAAIISSEGVDHLAVSDDGRTVGWANEWGFFTYDVEIQQLESWECPTGLLALGWRN